MFLSNFDQMILKNSWYITGILVICMLAFLAENSSDGTLVPGFYCGGTDLDGRPARVKSWNLARFGRLFLKSGFVGLVTSLFPRIFFFGEMA